MTDKTARKLRGLRGDQTQATVANAVGISISAYSSYELGVRRPSDEVKKRLADYFGTSVGELFF